MTVGMGFTYVLGMIISAVVGYFVIRFLLKLVQKGKLRNFAFYCFLAGFFISYSRVSDCMTGRMESMRILETGGAPACPGAGINM